MKLVLAGANGTGKSTLANKLHEVVGPGHKLLTYSRPTAAAQKLGYKSAREVPSDQETQCRFQELCLFEQIHAQSELGENYISDRSTIDPLAFLGYKLPHLKLTDWYNLYERMAVEFLNADMLIFVPNFGESPLDNGIRLLTPQEPVEAEFKRLFDKHQIPHYTLTEKTLKTRLDEVMKILGNI